MGTLFLITLSGIIGLIVGWNLPQPKYVKKVQDWVVSKIKDIGPDINL
jgi:hypothetical protein